MDPKRSQDRDTSGRAAAKYPSRTSRDTKLAKIRRLNQVRGTPSQVDAGPTREIVQQLVDRGMLTPAIARAAAVPYYRVKRLLKVTGKGFPQKRIMRDLALRIEKVQFVPDTTLYGRSALGVRRRVEALIWNGWQQLDIAAGIGRSEGYLSEILSGHEPGVSETTWQAVNAFYDAHSHEFGGNEKARSRAIERGFAPPGAWDGVDIDNPAARPIGVRREPPNTRKTRPTTR